jgi:hypothetical protein
MNSIRPEIKNELWTITGKTLASLAIGPFLTEAIFDLRGKLKQKRVNEFVESFASHLEIAYTLNTAINPLSTEAFSDIWENALLKVARTRSVKKMQLFQNLLLTHILSEADPDLTEMYLDIIDRISEKQLLILSGLYHGYGGDFIFLHEKVYELRTEIRTIESEREREQTFVQSTDRVYTMDKFIKKKREEQEQLLEEIKKASEWYAPEKYNCTASEYFFLLQDLSSKGLIIDMGSKFNADPFTIVEVNQMGTDILKFLNTPAG